MFLIVSILLPLLVIMFPLSVVVLLIMMALWGIYYELINFADFSIVEKLLPKNRYSHAMSLIQTSYAIGFVISAPAISWLANIDYRIPFAISVFFLLLGALMYKLIPKRNSFHSQLKIYDQAPSHSNRLKIWLILLKKVWPMYLFFILIYFLHVTNWTVGTLLAFDLQNESLIGYFLISLFTLPIILVTGVPGYLAKHFSKKSSAFACGAISGMFFLLVILSSNPWLIAGFIFLGTVAMSIAIPLTKAVFEDYVERLDSTQMEMVGIQASAVSISYIIGPIFIGAIAQFTNIQTTYFIIGLIALIFSLILLFKMKGKIKMPQKELNGLKLIR